MPESTDRRTFLNRALLGTAGAGAIMSREEKILLAAVEEQAAGEQSPQPAPEALPKGKIGDLEMSRMLLGDFFIHTAPFSEFNSRDLNLNRKLLCMIGAGSLNGDIAWNTETISLRKFQYFAFVINMPFILQKFGYSLKKKPLQHFFHFM